MIQTCEECGTPIDTKSDAYYREYAGWKKNGTGSAVGGGLGLKVICAHHADRKTEMPGQTDIYGGVTP